MSSVYQGGLGEREGGDLVRWRLEVDRLLNQAELTLYDVSRDESVAVVQLLNEMRSASRGIVLTPSKQPSIGDRFAGLDLG